MLSASPDCYDAGISRAAERLKMACNKKRIDNKFDNIQTSEYFNLPFRFFAKEWLYQRK